MDEHVSRPHSARRCSSSICRPRTGFGPQETTPLQRRDVSCRHCRSSTTSNSIHSIHSPSRCSRHDASGSSSIAEGWLHNANGGQRQGMRSVRGRVWYVCIGTRVWRGDVAEGEGCAMDKAPNTTPEDQRSARDLCMCVRAYARAVCCDKMR